MLKYFMLFCVVLCYIILRYFVMFYVILMLFCIILCYFFCYFIIILCYFYVKVFYVILYYFMLFYAVLYYSILCHGILCFVTSHKKLFINFSLKNAKTLCFKISLKTESSCILTLTSCRVTLQTTEVVSRSRTRSFRVTCRLFSTPSLLQSAECYQT